MDSLGRRTKEKGRSMKEGERKEGCGEGKEGRTGMVGRGEGV